MIELLKNIKCRLCDKEFSRKCELSRHLKSNHNSNNDFNNLIFLCRKCHTKIHNSLIFKPVQNELLFDFKQNINMTKNDVLNEIKNNNGVKNGVFE